MLALMLVYYLGVGLGVALGYHRGLAHRSVEFVPWLRRTLVLLGLPAGPPVVWAGNHRHHHLHTDTDGDPHSPLRDGFWYAHTGWYLGTHSRVICMLYAAAGPMRMLYDAFWRPLDRRGMSRLAADASADPWVRFLSTRGGFIGGTVLHMLPSALAWTLDGWRGVAWLFALQVAMYNAGDAVNSLGHMWGEQSYRFGTDGSRNNRWLAVLTMGDGWHNNHHAYPSSARHGLHAGEWDFTWWCVQRFQRRGWIRRITSETYASSRNSLRRGHSGMD